MNKILIILIVSLFSVTAHAQDKYQDKYVAFDNTHYKLAFTQSTKPVDINEYLPEGQTLTGWTKMIALHRYNDVDLTPLEFAHEFAEVVKRTSSQAGSRILKNDQTQEVMIEFITWTQQEPIIGEFNIFRFRTDEKTGKLVGLQYAFRHYGPPNKAYEDEITNNKARWVQLLASQPIPEYFARN